MPSPSDALPKELDFAADDDASADRMNRAMVYILAQLRAALAQRAEYQAVLDGLAQLGLQRLADALTPVVQLAQTEAAALQAVYDQWVAGGALVALHNQVTTETDGKIELLQAGIGQVNDRVDAASAAATALANRQAGDRWFSNHG